MRLLVWQCERGGEHLDTALRRQGTQDQEQARGAGERQAEVVGKGNGERGVVGVVKRAERGSGPRRCLAVMPV